MAQYKPLVLTPEEQKIVGTLKLHARDMFPTAQPAGHDWQHIDSQMTLWQHVGGSVLEELQFAGKVNPMVPFIVSLGHDLNRLSAFMLTSKFSKKELVAFSGQKLEEALAHNENADVSNDRARMRMISMYEGFLRVIVEHELRYEAMAILTYSGNINNLTPAAYIVCDDLDKAITGHFYAWRCAAVGAGQRVKRDVVKNYLIAKLSSSESARLIADERLEVWIDDLEWFEDCDPCVAKPPQQFVIRSTILHEIADPGFQILRRVYAETVQQLRTIGYEITVPPETAERLLSFGYNV